MHVPRTVATLVLALTTPALADITFHGGVTVDVALDLTPLIDTGNWSASLSASTPTYQTFQYGDFSRSAITSFSAQGVANTSPVAYGFSNAVSVSGYTNASSTINSIIGEAYVEQTYTLALDPQALGNTVPFVVIPLTINWSDNFSFTSSDGVRDAWGYYARFCWVRQLPYDEPGIWEAWSPSSFIFDPSLGSPQGAPSSGAFSGSIVLSAGQTVTFNVVSRVSLRADTIPTPSLVPALLAFAIRRRRTGLARLSPVQRSDPTSWSSGS